MRILIVEDEYSLADLVSARLKKEKYTVDVSYDGEAKYNGGTIIVNGETVNTITNQFMGGGMGGMPQEGNMPDNRNMPQGGRRMR